MKEEKRVVELNRLEHGAVVHCLNDARSQLLQEQKSTDVVDDLLLKIIDAPTRKSRRARWHNEAR